MDSFGLIIIGVSVLVVICSAVLVFRLRHLRTRSKRKEDDVPLVFKTYNMLNFINKLKNERRNDLVILSVCMTILSFFIVSSLFFMNYITDNNKISAVCCPENETSYLPVVDIQESNLYPHSHFLPPPKHNFVEDSILNSPQSLLVPTTTTIQQKHGSVKREFGFLEDELPKPPSTLPFARKTLNKHFDKGSKNDPFCPPSLREKSDCR